MSEPMSAERLAEIKARAEAADKGPWAVDEMLMVESDAGAIGDYYFHPESEAEFAAMKADAEFSAHARVDVPDLLAEVERLRAHEKNVASNETDYEQLLVAVEQHLYRALPDAVAEDGLVPNMERLASEIVRLRAAVPAWADLKELLAEHRDSNLTDNELTNKVMALWGGAA